MATRQHPTSIRLPDDEFRRLKAEADADGRSVANLIRLIVRRHLDAGHINRSRVRNGS